MLVFSCFYLIFELGTSSTNIIKRGPQWRRREAPSPRGGNLGSSSKQKSQSEKDWLFCLELLDNGLPSQSPAKRVWLGEEKTPPGDVFQLAGTYDLAVFFLTSI